MIKMVLNNINYNDWAFQGSHDNKNRPKNYHWAFPVASHAGLQESNDKKWPKQYHSAFPRES